MLGGIRHCASDTLALFPLLAGYAPSWVKDCLSYA